MYSDDIKPHSYVLSNHEIDEYILNELINNSMNFHDITCIVTQDVSSLFMRNFNARMKYLEYIDNTLLLFPPIF